jgi:ribonuclease HI
VAKQKFYVVWRGRKPGIYTSWAEAEQQVKGVAGARFKSFPSRGEAEAALQAGPRPGRGPSASRRSGTSRAQTLTMGTGAGASAHTATRDVDIYCDGACDPNPGPAGTGIAIYRKAELAELWYGLYNPAGTNNSAELQGLYHALAFAERAVGEGLQTAIHCDSRYAIDCVTKWAFGWKARDWTRKTGAIMNLEVIQAAHERYIGISERIEVLHVPGHAGIEGNELADRMSMLAIREAQRDLAAYPAPFDIPALLALNRG